MKTLKNGVLSLVLFATLVGLMLTGFNGFKDGYTITETDLNNESQNIMESLNNLQIIQGMEVITEAFKQKAATASGFDILGALASSAIGVIQLVIGLLTLPFEIIFIIATYYSIPGHILVGIGVFISVSVMFLFIRLKTGNDV